MENFLKTLGPIVGVVCILIGIYLATKAAKEAGYAEGHADGRQKGYEDAMQWKPSIADIVELSNETSKLLNELKNEQ